MNDIPFVVNGGIHLAVEGSREASGDNQLIGSV